MMPDHLSAEVEPYEQIARFVRNSKDMRRSVGRPGYRAYLPREESGEISVYRTTDVTDGEIRHIGANYVATPTSPIKGYCCLVASAFLVEGLYILPAPDRHYRHANVAGWDNDAENRLIARRLAEQADLVEY